MNLVLTMAGKYTRFKSDGYKVPKYLLPWKRHTILAEILDVMRRGFDNIFLVANEDDREYAPHLSYILSNHWYSDVNLFYIKDTSGQAETAYVSVQEIYKVWGDHILEQPLAFHNIDTILYNRNYTDMRSKLTRHRGYIDIFKSSNHQYSYVLTEPPESQVYEISEKILISNMATSGLYGFDCGQLYIDKFEDAGQPTYISEVYKYMIDMDYPIVTSELHSEKDTWVLGTPDEYMNLSRRL